MSLPTVIKQPSESRLFTMDFSALLEPSETITGIVSGVVDKVTIPALVLSDQVFGPTVVQFRLAGGKVSTKYEVTFIVTTSGGNTLEGEGIVQVDEL